MNDNSKTDAPPSWYTPPAASAPPDTMAWPSSPAADATATPTSAEGWPAPPAPEAWTAPAAPAAVHSPAVFTHLSNDQPAPQPGFTHLSNDQPAPQPGFTHISNDQPAPQPGFTHISNDQPAPQPGFTHLSNDAPSGGAPAPRTPSSLLGAALAPPTPLVRPLAAPRPDAAEPPVEFAAGFGDALRGSVPSGIDAVPSQPAERAPYDPFHHEQSDEVVDGDRGGPGWHIRESASSAVAPLPVPGAPSADAVAAPTVVMPWDAKRKPSPLRRYLLLGAGLFALCGLTVLVLTNVGRTGPSIQQPSSVGTLSQVDAPLVTPTLQSLDHFERSVGATNVVTGIYGDNGQPQMLLVVVQNPLLSGGGTPQALQSFMRGLTSGAGSVGWVLDPAKATTTTAGNITFECNSGPASGLDGTVLTACAWTDPGVAGAVIDLSGQPLTDTLNETVLARAAAVH